MKAIETPAGKFKGRCINLNDVRGIYAGRAGVVCGAGPSLRFVDARLYKHVVIAVNDAFDKLPLSPYYSSCDPSMTQHWHWDNVRSSNCVTAVTTAWGFGSKGQMAGVDRNRVLHFGRHDGLKMLPSDGKLIFGPSSAHVAAHLAYVMGCSPIYLVGCDCRCESGKKYYWEFQNQPRGGMKDGAATYVLSEMKRLGKKPKPGNYDEWYRLDGTPTGSGLYNWGAMKEINPNVNIIDASGRSGGAIAQAGIYPSIDVLDVMGRRKT